MQGIHQFFPPQIYLEKQFIKIFHRHNLHYTVILKANVLEIVKQLATNYTIIRLLSVRHVV